MVNSVKRWRRFGRRWAVWGGVLALVTVGLVARLHIIQQTDFDGLYGQDSYAYYGYGVDVRAALVELRVPGPMFWPLGFPLLLATGFLLGGVTPTNAQLIPVLTGSITGGLIFLLTYDLVRHLKRPPSTAFITGMFAGLLLLFSGQWLQSSMVVMSDAPALMWVVLSAWAMVRYGDIITTPRIARRWLMLAAISLGLAVITRWVFGLLLIPWGLYCFVVWRGRVRWRDVMLAGLPFALILLLQMAHSHQNPAAFAHHSWLQDWNPANATLHEFTNPDGTFLYHDTVSIFYARTLADDFYLDARLRLIFALGVLLMLWRIRRTLPVVILLGGWGAVAYGFLIGIPYENTRFALAFFPPAVIIIGIGMGGIWYAGGRLPVVGWLLRALLIAGCWTALQTTYQTGLADIERLATVKHKDLAAIEWAAAHIPEGQATVYTLDLQLMMVVYTPALDARQIYYETPQSLAADLDPTQPTYLLLNLWTIENQWVDKAPWIAYHWIKERYPVQHIGRQGNYHLLRIEPADES